MSLQLPRKRTILAWHRWLGIASALFLLSLSITGLALNHTEFLKLDQVQIKSSVILNRYGMASGESIDAYRIHQSDTLAHLNGQLFYNNAPLASASRPLGIIEGDPISVVATETQLIYLTTEGEFIESIDSNQLPYTTLIAVGTTIDGSPLLISAEGNWTPDADWLEFDRYQASYNVEPLETITLDEANANTLLDAFQGGGVSLYRVLLDLHSGRLFGWAGRTLMDLSAIAIIILITSGIGGWLRKSRRPKTPPIS
ncbi:MULTISPECIES: PepSY domain-containing protein [unclassified Lentimonas]|uniref:PepSY domain-containing protein n=1 Tax=unclassified Lentimonas TaxID=2630993 RepID=UPI0013299851|nr:MULTISPECIES: PepSY domain-containing protein [unclassified Lentimonas]CAA6678864.1 Unannotated [Lentimonas sp. CC4]CAA6684468.1 Unannotated [Lentimonas sp. CC6]CAA6692768.1 Unannotated [Lentimonas sp. CC19]CAA6695070.1 Unannotated [Lentimonas sp. CC10]CAA7069668.1 Unannotated [Lentimonas sp. CC11]